ncbi:MAG TPA: hypothetical protein VGL53_07060, partial [Bryobacteraceae bacterium]
MRGVGPDEDFAQIIPEERAFGHLHGEHGKIVEDAVLRVLTELVAVRGDDSEDEEDGFAVDAGGGFGQIESAVVEEEVGSG